MPFESDIDRKRVLKELPLFAKLPSDIINELTLGSRSETFDRGEAIFRSGDPARQMFVLLSGQVKLSLSSNRGSEKILDVIGAGRSFGEAELFGPRVYLAGAEAVKPSQLLCIAGESVRRVMTMDSRVAERIVSILAHRQIQMEAELAASHFCFGSHRLLEFFLQLAGPNLAKTGETRVTLSISKRLLASRFDMQPETLSRALRDLTAAGLISVDKTHISLKNANIQRYLEDESSEQSIILPERLRMPHTGENGYAVVSSVSNTIEQIAVAPPIRDSINKAGRQRMLSQRMAKSWLMLERGIMSRRARLIIKQSIEMFDRQMIELAAEVSEPVCRAACDELRHLWPSYRLLLDSDPTPKGAQELFSINEDVLAAAQHLVLSLERADGTPLGRMVNMAGRERMLSQRAAKLFMFQNMGIQVSRCQDELQHTLEEFSTTLAQLCSTAHDQPRIKIELDKVAQHWDALQSAIRSDRELNFSPVARKVFTTSENLLQRMDTAVNLYAGLPN
ncbi:MAG: type IV pili methyl-accepting chemotaxis transducer N-terminal domain-containing protein [Sulfuritalea sp.]|nr:type IV pili methyl-accepting chemotaxis transducer N-terminal domain-containing protein [Sulfuritalea sp.]